MRGSFAEITQIRLTRFHPFPPTRFSRRRVELLAPGCARLRFSLTLPERRDSALVALAFDTAGVLRAGELPKPPILCFGWRRMLFEAIGNREVRSHQEPGISPKRGKELGQAQLRTKRLHTAAHTIAR